MTIKELREKLEGLPDSMDVFIMQLNTEYAISLLEQAEVKEAEFVGERLKASDKCMILTDES